MKLYGSYRAPNPRRVRWFMAEKGIDIIGHALEFAQILVWWLGKHGMKEEHVERI